MDPFVWACVLLVAGLALVLIEFFVPSSGVLAVSAFTCLVVSVVLAFRQSHEWGLAFLAGAVLGTPIMLALGIKWWPQTPIGRRILPRIPSSEEVLPDTALRRELKSLLGKHGVARSMMMPSGAVEVEGHVIDASSEGQSIENGTPVKVIEVEGTRVVVRAESNFNTPGVVKKALPASDVLSQSVESLGLGDLELDDLSGEHKK